MVYLIHCRETHELLERPPSCCWSPSSSTASPPLPHALLPIHTPPRESPCGDLKAKVCSWSPTSPVMFMVLLSLPNLPILWMKICLFCEWKLQYHGWFQVDVVHYQIIWTKKTDVLRDYHSILGFSFSSSTKRLWWDRGRRPTIYSWGIWKVVRSCGDPSYMTWMVHCKIGCP